jgi:hypothetical protein
VLAQIEATEVLTNRVCGSGCVNVIARDLQNDIQLRTRQHQKTSELKRIDIALFFGELHIPKGFGELSFQG